MPLPCTPIVPKTNKKRARQAWAVASRNRQCLSWRNIAITLTIRVLAHRNFAAKRRKTIALEDLYRLLAWPKYFGIQRAMLKFEGFESQSSPPLKDNFLTNRYPFSDCLPFACVVPRLYLTPENSIRCTWLSCIFHHEECSRTLMSDVGPLISLISRSRLLLRLGDKQVRV